MEDVTFKISEPGRQRVISQQRKNVHAYAIGEIVERNGTGYSAHLPCASYNPYNAGHFVNTATGKRVDRTYQAIFTTDRQVRIPQWEPFTTEQAAALIRASKGKIFTNRLTSQETKV
jgi:hypothetical protein